jgi:hypothetical protein
MKVFDEKLARTYWGRVKASLVRKSSGGFDAAKVDAHAIDQLMVQSELAFDEVVRLRNLLDENEVEY